MRKIASLPLLLAVVLALFAASCSTGRLHDRVRAGLWAAQNNLWDEAIFRWRQAAAEDPGSAAAHNNMAVAYEKKGLYADALREYEIALKLVPGNSYVKANYRNCKENSQAPDPAGTAKEPKIKDEKR